jgi:putative ATP-binding cassette transporter
MNIIKVLLKESRSGMLRCALFSLGAGGANGLLLIIVSEVIATRNFHSLRAIAAFFGMLIISQVLRFATNVTIAGVVESMTVNMRLAILKGLQGCRLEDFEKIGQSRIHNSLTNDCASITRFIPDLIELITAAVTISVCMIYLLWLSRFVFLMAVIIMAAGTSLYLLRQRFAATILAGARSQLNETYKLILDFLNGFKELKMNPLKSNDLFDNHIRPGLYNTRDLLVSACKVIQLNYSFGLGLFFLLLGLVLFYMPHRYPGDGAMISRVAVVLLYMIAPGGQFLYGALQFVKAKVAMDNLENLRLKIESKRIQYLKKAGHEDVNRLDGFSHISLKQVSFSYAGKSGMTSFTVGPIDMEIARGQALFITGGNGSGKSTLCKLLTGLYTPQKGAVYVDKSPVSEDNADAYRALFSTVFSDFYLFDRLYGTVPDQDHVEKWLKLFNLSHKVSIDQGKLSTTNLSAGQRRRLALLAALVDDRPVLVFDELTADQETEFREYFYNEFIPAMKAQGKTQIIITHDDRYFHLADQMVKLEYGSSL